MVGDRNSEIVAQIPGEPEQDGWLTPATGLERIRCRYSQSWRGGAEDLWTRGRLGQQRGMGCGGARRRTRVSPHCVSRIDTY